MAQAVAPSLLALAVVGGTLGDVPCSYQVEILPNIPCPGPLQDPGVLGKAVNNAGVVTGFYLDTCTFGDLIDEGFTWTPETGIVTIPRPPGVISLQAYDISDTGLVVGRHVDIGFSDPGMYGFIYNGKRLTNMYTLPGGTSSQANAVNSAGVAVGWWGNIVTGVPTGSDAFIYSDGVMKGLGDILGTPRSAALDISENQLITGWMGSSFGANDVRAFVLKDEVVTTLPPVPGGLTSVGEAITADGWVTGYGKVVLPDDDIALRCFVWDGRNMTLLEVLPGTKSCRVTGIMPNHDVIGYCYDGPDFDTRPFLWSQDVMHEIRDLIRVDGLTVFGPDGVNDTGEIVSDAWLDGDGVTVVLRPVMPRFADFDCSGSVGLDDIEILLTAWGLCTDSSCTPDLDKNGIVNGFDLALLLASWG